MDVLVSNYNNQGGEVVKNLTPFFIPSKLKWTGFPLLPERLWVRGPPGEQITSRNSVGMTNKGVGGLIIQPFFYTFIENNYYARKK